MLPFYIALGVVFVALLHRIRIIFSKLPVTFPSQMDSPNEWKRQESNDSVPPSPNEHSIFGRNYEIGEIIQHNTELPGAGYGS